MDVVREDMQMVGVTEDRARGRQMTRCGDT